MKKVGDPAYELNFPRQWRVHRVVSVAHLYPAPPNTDPWKRRRPEPGRISVEELVGKYDTKNKLSEDELALKKAAIAEEVPAKIQEVD